jgi:hypothetical protein
MGTTTNNGWTYPESTDLVKDGATAIQTLADDIDTTLGVYAPSSSGLTLINTTSFSGVSSQSFNDVFSATYENYVVVMCFECTADTGVFFRWRVSGTDDSSANYSWVQMNNFGGATTPAGTGANTATSARITQVNAATSSARTHHTFFRPFATDYSGYVGTILGGTGRVNYLQGTTGMGFNGTTSFTGFSLLPTTGTITGFVKIYGLAN